MKSIDNPRLIELIEHIRYIRRFRRHIVHASHISAVCYVGTDDEEVIWFSESDREVIKRVMLTLTQNRVQELTAELDSLLPGQFNPSSL